MLLPLHIKLHSRCHNILPFQALQAADNNAVAACFANEAGFELTNVQ